MYSTSSRLITTSLFIAAIISLNGTKPASWIGTTTVSMGEPDRLSITYSNWKSFIGLIYRSVVEIKGMMLPDEARLFSTLLLSYPLAWILRIGAPMNHAVKHSFIIGTTILYLVYIFRDINSVLTLGISCLTSYAIAKYVRGPVMPWIGVALLTGHLCITQFARLYAVSPRSYLVHISSPHMNLVIKLTAFCWNVHDGRVPENSLSAFQRQNAIKPSTFPSLLEFLGYALFFPTMFYGPGFDYSEYRRFVNLSIFDPVPQQEEGELAHVERRALKIPDGTRAALRKAAAGLFWTFLFFKLSAICSLDLLLSDRFMEFGFLRRLLAVHLFALTLRVNQYGVWALIEGATILSGIGYNGINPNTNEHCWDRMRNVNPWGVELAQNPYAYIGNWNLKTCNWLKNYVYLRVVQKEQKPGFKASMITFCYSALWHGFAPGYYVTFVLVGVLQLVAKDNNHADIRRVVRPYFVAMNKRDRLLKKLYDFSTFICTQLSFDFFVVPFMVNRVSVFIDIWSRLHYYALFAMVLGLILFSSGLVGYVSKIRASQHQRSSQILISALQRFPGRASKYLSHLVPFSYTH